MINILDSTTSNCSRVRWVGIRLAWESAIFIPIYRQPKVTLIALDCVDGNYIDREAFRQIHFWEKTLTQLIENPVVPILGISPYSSLEGRPSRLICIDDGDHLVRKASMSRVERKNTRLRHYLARWARKSLCYSKSEQRHKYSIRLLLHYLRYRDLPPISAPLMCNAEFPVFGFLA